MNISDTLLSNSPLTPETFTQLTTAVEKNWPTASYLPKSIQTTSIYEYANSMIRPNSVQGTASRRKEFQETMQIHVEKLFGETIGKEVAKQLETNHSIVTAQHYTPISSVETISPTLQTSLGYAGRTEAERKHIIVLACAGISFANFCNPRGYSFHSFAKDAVHDLHLHFFGRTIDPYPVIYAKAYTKDAQKQIEKRVQHFRSEQLLSKQLYKKLEEVLPVFFSEKMLSQENYIDQISIQNFEIWNMIFANQTVKNANLIFLSQEKIAMDLLMRYHLHSETLLTKILFDSSYHTLMLKYFNNIQCAFSLEKNYGTFLFWGMTHGGTKRVQLFPQNGKLVSQDETFSVELTPEAISQAIETKQVMPSVMLTFLVLSQYYGLFLTGGLRQPWYLSEIKQAYQKMLTELGLTDEQSYLEPVSTNDSVVMRAGLVFLDQPTLPRIPATGLDILFYSRETSFSDLIAGTKQVPYQQLYYRSYPELYREFVEEKDERLAQITESDIETFTNMKEKLPSWGSLIG